MNKTKIVKILVPVLIVITIIGIYFLKTKDNASEETNSSTNEQLAANSELNEDAVAYPLKITSVDLEKIKNYGVPTVIDFGSDSCIPCKEMAPVLETLNAEWQGKAAVQFMDVWKYSEGVQDFPVQVIPTQVFFNADGTPFVPSEELAAKIQFDMYSMRDTGDHVFTVHQGGISEEDMRLIFAEMGVE